MLFESLEEQPGRRVAGVGEGMESVGMEAEWNISTERGFCGPGCRNESWHHLCLEEKATVLPSGQREAAEEAGVKVTGSVGRRLAEAAAVFGFVFFSI